MNSFIKRVFFFFLILASVFVVIALINSVTRSGTSYKPNKKTTVLLTGDSHAKLALNPKFITNSENIAMEGCPLPVTYFQIRHVLSQPNSIQKVICSISPAAFSQNMDDFFEDKAKLKGVYERSLPLADYSTELDFLEKNEYFYVSLFRYYCMPDFRAWKRKLMGSRNYPYIGKFKPAKKRVVKTDYIQELIANQFTTGDSLSGISEVALTYFEKINTLCTEQDKELIWLRTPTMPSYQTEIPQLFTDHFNSAISASKCKFIDKSNVLDSANLFRDVHHLNAKGAEKISKELNQSLINFSSQ